MTDLEITKLCAEAMGYSFKSKNAGDRLYVMGSGEPKIYDPLHDDAQAMALVKKFHLDLDTAIVTKYGEPEIWGWRVRISNVSHERNKDLNIAICECVANMQRRAAAGLT